MCIDIQKATVYYSPGAKRRYFSKRAAISAEAKSIIYKIYPEINENGIDYKEQTGEYFDIAIHRPEYYDRRKAQLCRAIRGRMRRDAIDQGKFNN